MKVAYLAIGMTSPLHASFELCRRLAEAGHRVTYLSQAAIEAEVRAQGHDFVPLENGRRLRQEAEGLEMAWRDLARPRLFATRLAARRRLRRRSIANDEIETAVRRIEPDLLLVDIEMHFAVIATRSLSVPTWLTLPFFSPFRRPGLPPLHTRLPPATNAAERRRLEWSWRRLRLETLHFEWRNRLGQWLRCELAPPVDYHTFEIDDLRAVARQRRVSLRRLASRADWLRPYLYRRLPILCLNAREMDLPHDSPPHLHYVGPMVHAKRVEARLDAASRARWHRFRDRAAASGRPLVYCSLGSFWSGDGVFLRRVVDVFARRQDWWLVIGLGGQLDAEALEPIPDNLLALEWAPQLEVLSQAQCAVTHGGVASINECIRLAVPMVVYSTGFVEQDGNATRVAFNGLGLVADKARDGASDLENNVAQALTDPEIRRRLEAMRDRFLEYERSGLAVELLEHAARSSGPPKAPGAPTSKPPSSSKPSSIPPHQPLARSRACHEVL